MGSGRARIADAPAGHGIRLGEAVQDDGALARAWQAAEADVLAVGEPVVDLVGQQIEVVPIGSATSRSGRARDCIAPVGLAGEPNSRAFVRGVMAAATRSASSRKPSQRRSGTGTVTPPANSTQAHRRRSRVPARSPRRRVQQHAQRQIETFRNPDSDEALRLRIVVRIVPPGQLAQMRSPSDSRPLLDV